MSAIAHLPVGVRILLHHQPSLQYVGHAVVADVMSSAVPFLVDLAVLRRVPTGFFGLFMSINPLLAVLVGWVVLDQTFGLIEWLAIVTANTIAAATPAPTQQVDYLGLETMPRTGEWSGTRYRDVERKRCPHR